MTETGLLIAQVAFLVLLYLFIWSVVRSSRRDLEQTTPVVAGPASGETAASELGREVVARGAEVLRRVLSLIHISEPTRPY